MYLYRAVDERGRTVESHLSRTRDVAAAKAFFRKALKHRWHPRTITMDGFEPTHSALRPHGHAERVQLPVGEPRRDRVLSNLNNIVEQDHRRIKARVQPMLGYKTFYNARRVLMGVELMQMIHKRQFHTL
jgi:putative transposase